MYHILAITIQYNPFQAMAIVLCAICAAVDYADGVIFAMLGWSTLSGFPGACT